MSSIGIYFVFFRSYYSSFFRFFKKNQRKFLIRNINSVFRLVLSYFGQKDFHLALSQLLDVVCSDYYFLGGSHLILVDHFLSFLHSGRIFFLFHTFDSESIYSIQFNRPNVIWYERESRDLFGLTFQSSESNRRLLLDYHFKGSPLRKDFPIFGFFEVYYDFHEGVVSYKKTTLSQEFRFFDRVTPWSQAISSSIL